MTNWCFYRKPPGIGSTGGAWTLISMQLAVCPWGLDPGKVIGNIYPTLLGALSGRVRREEGCQGPTRRPTVALFPSRAFWMTEFCRAGDPEGDKFWIRIF